VPPLWGSRGGQCHEPSAHALGCPIPRQWRTGYETSLGEEVGIGEWFSLFGALKARYNDSPGR